jgi:hypothetical protein
MERADRKNLTTTRHTCWGRRVKAGPSQKERRATQISFRARRTTMRSRVRKYEWRAVGGIDKVVSPRGFIERIDRF